MTAHKGRSRVSSLLAITTAAIVAVGGALFVPAAAQAADAPTLTVSKSTNIDAAGETLTVKGSGYNPDQSIYLTFCGDNPLAEVDFNFIAAGCTTGARLITKSPKSPSQVQFQADGSFETTIAVTPRPGATAGTALYTIADHTGMTNRTQDAKAELKFGAPVAVTIPQVQAAEGELKVSVNAANVQTLSSDAGVYAALIVKGSEAELGMGSQGAAADFVVKSRIVDGKFASTLTAPASKLDRSKQYEVLVWRAHGNATPDRIVGRADVAVSAAQWDTVFPAPKVTFTDVKAGDKFYKEIDWFAQQGITTGTKQADGTLKYLPKDSVTRESMAAFLYRLEGKPAFTAPAKSPFVDLKTSDKFYKEITWLADRGITTGTTIKGKSYFQPKLSVSREAMAAFLYRFDGKPNFTAPVKSPFVDLQKGDKFYKEITWLVNEKVTTGTTKAGKVYYEPKDSVTREAMAAFIYRLEHRS